MDQRDEAVGYIRMNGPVLPVQIAKRLGTEILFASAILSELVSSKHIRTTKLSIGGSPLYYLPGQESLLIDRLYNSMNAAEKDAYNLLKEKQVLLEKDLTPVLRTALRSLKDFASYIVVKDDDREFGFWKFHLLPDQIAQERITKIISSLPKEQKPLVQEIIKDIPKEQKQQIDQSTLDNIKEQIINELKPKIIKDTKLEEKKALKKKQEQKPEGRFFDLVNIFFSNNKVNLLKTTIIKKDKEFDFLVEVPSNLGVLTYYVKAKNKAKISETDIALAYSDGQIKKLPVLFVSQGMLTKKAKEYVDKLKRSLIFKKI